MKSYYGIVHKDPDSSFGVSFPDLPGCFSAADNESEILSEAQIAVALYAKDADDLPEPRSIEVLRRDAIWSEEIDDAVFVIAVPLIVEESKSRYNLMLDRNLVSGIDAAARASGLSRSDFVARTLEDRLSSERGMAFAKKPAKGRGEGTNTVSAASKAKKFKTASKAAKSAAASALTQKKTSGKTVQSRSSVSAGATGRRNTG